MKPGELKRSTPLKRSPLGREGQRSTEDRLAAREREVIGSSAVKRERLVRRRATVVGRAEKVKRKAWNRGIRGQACARCPRMAVEAHHIIRLQVLRREAQSHGFDFEVVRWDERNRLGLCERCHREHHSARRRLTKEILRHHAPRILEFAAELGLLHQLDREYA